MVNSEERAGTVKARVSDLDCGRRVLAACLAASTFATSVVAAETTTSQDCELPNPIQLSGLPKQRLVLIGEIHGAQETPALLATWACHLSRLSGEKGPGVLVALEIPVDEQERLDAFMRSPGAAGDRAALLQGRFWQRPARMQDGRSSLAKLQLIERLRALRADGADLVLRAIDVTEVSSMSRDAGMAANLRRAMAAHPTHQALGLFGNVHVALQRGSSWDAEYESLGYLLQAEGARAVFVTGEWGTTWNCRRENRATEPVLVCGPSRFGKPNDTAVARLQTDDPRYNATWMLPRLTASPPARGVETAAQPD